MQVGRKSQVAKSDIKWTLCGKKFWTGCNQGSNSSSVEENNNRTGKDKDRKKFSCKRLFIFSYFSYNSKAELEYKVKNKATLIIILEVHPDI